MDQKRGENYDIYIAHSVDEGQTWTYPKSLSKTDGIGVTSDTDPRIVSSATGMVLVVWYRYSAVPGEMRILLSRSADWGATWSQPEFLNSTPSKTFERSATVATDGKGTWVALWPAWLSEDGPFLMSAYSTDDALTWSVPAVVVPNTFPTLGVNEFVNVSTDGQGNWIAVLAAARRANGSDSDIYAIRSADNGATWTSPEPVNPDAESDSADDSWPAITTDGHGRWMVAWRRRAKGSNDADILVAQSIDNGTTWSTSVPANLYSRTGERQDYLPVIVTDGRAVWLAAWIGGKHGLRLAF